LEAPSTVVDFVASPAAHAHPVIAAFAQFESALLRVKRGNPGGFIVVRDHNRGSVFSQRPVIDQHEQLTDAEKVA
jgi:hypothetical protein